MSYVVTVVGAGGKTTLIRRLAAEAIKNGKTVAVTTTTHIWKPMNEDSLIQAGVVFAGVPLEVSAAEGENEEAGNQSMKLKALRKEAYEELCAAFDLILVEGDGAHCMPVKIPDRTEPVIPENTDEIIVVMGNHAVGRRIRTVCHRYEDFEEGLQDLCTKDSIVTQELLRCIADRYYIFPLQREYSGSKPNVKISYYLSKMQQSPQGVRHLALVMTASGFGRRFGSNKLVHEYKGKLLYRHMLEKLLVVSKKLEKKYKMTCSIVIVTRYQEILEDIQDRSRSVQTPLTGIFNGKAEEGIAASIRIGTEAVLKAGADAVAFFAADMPELPEKDIERFLQDFLLSGKNYACMEIIPGHIPVNPGAFRLFGQCRDESGKEIYAKQQMPKEELRRLQGDRGAMRIIRRHPADTYYYQIENGKVRDIDRKKDMKK